jgi:hypothetical protein
LFQEYSFCLDSFCETFGTLRKIFCLLIHAKQFHDSKDDFFHGFFSPASLAYSLRSNAKQTHEPDKGKPLERVGRKATGLSLTFWRYGRRAAGRTPYLLHAERIARILQGGGTIVPTFSILGKFRKAILSSVSLFFVTGSAASLLLVLGLLLLAFPCHVYAGQVTLAWNANTEIDLGGYKLYYGQASRNYTASVDVGNNTTYTLGGLGTGQTYYFAVTAYDRISLDESDFSNEAQVTIPGASPAAAFNASPTSGIAPLSVVFTDTSSGSITTWSWNFGDGLTTVGNSVSDQNPTHTYSGSGAYTVSLAVSGPDGSNTATKTN